MKLVSIHIAGEKGAAMTARSEVRAVAGRGLEGDRYFDGPKPGQQVTIIEEETLAPEGHARRNLVTRGARLNDLVGREFTVGEVRMKGLRLCEPCAYLEKKVGVKLIPELVHRAGLRAEILTDGMLRVGDPICS